LPELNLTNFHKNWNDGRALNALLDYCEPGLCPNWKDLDPANSEQHCEAAIRLAEEHFKIPGILSACDMSSPDLDELSCITYLSYFVKIAAPGYNATLRHVRKALGGKITGVFDGSCGSSTTHGRSINNIQKEIARNVWSTLGDHP
uniref:Calponin-homology (CH) domain-containing protein n=1 Tax=Gongylonema pulchrum TaxID=637853 RepID=A0A183CWG4_9BILA